MIIVGGRFVKNWHIGNEGGSIGETREFAVRERVGVEKSTRGVGPENKWRRGQGGYRLDKITSKCSNLGLIGSKTRSEASKT